MNSSIVNQRAVHVIIPAGGTGTRFGADIPKQYLPLAGKAVIWHAVNRLVQIDEIESIVVVVSPDEFERATACLSEFTSKLFGGGQGHRVTVIPQAGETRSSTVENGALYLRERGISAASWVLVHDAARPLVEPDNVRALLAALTNDIFQPDGGILAVPVTDTLKQMQSIDSHTPNRIERTVPRDRMWQAQTPQCFTLSVLLDILKNAHEKNISITDEAQAAELLECDVMLVKGDSNNIKITRPSDLAYAEWLLSRESKQR